MYMDTGIIHVIQVDPTGFLSAQVDCAPKLIPGPGRYLLAFEQGAPDSPLAWPLFPTGLHSALGGSSPPSLGPIPPTWGPRTSLVLRGPLGHGFNLPTGIRNLALAAIAETPSRLLPLIPPAIEAGVNITLFAPAPDLSSSLPSLPPAVEFQPLETLAEVLPWADFLALDLPLSFLPELRQLLQQAPHDRLPCPAQALIWTPMPCAGIGVCGACATPARQGGYKLACKDGPVFDLNELDW